MTLLFGLSALLLAQLTQSYPYSMYNAKRYPRTGYQPAYIPVPVPYAFPQQDGVEDMSLPNYRYYYYPVHADTRYGFYDEPSTDGETAGNSEEYPYGQETWYENGEENNAARAAANAEADAAFLRNLIITQMYQDAAASAAVGGGNPSRYAYQYMARPTQDYEEKNWLYGVPTTGIEDKERLRELPKNNEDEEVKELESLRKAAKEAKRRRKQKAKANQDNREKKESGDVALVTSKPLKSEGSSFSDRKNKLVVGQKEIVLPQPPRPVRKPFAELTQRLHTRSEEPSAYQTIKQLLAMENNSQKTDDSRLKKRFVSTEEQLTEQLSSLKKSTL